MAEPNEKYFPQNDINHVKNSCFGLVEQITANKAEPKSLELVPLFDFTGKSFHVPQPFENSVGDKVGYACETYPIKRSLVSAMEKLTSGDVKAAMDDINDALREINIAEFLSMPLLHLLPSNATVTPSRGHIIAEVVNVVHPSD